MVKREKLVPLAEAAIARRTSREKLLRDAMKGRGPELRQIAGKWFIVDPDDARGPRAA